MLASSNVNIASLAKSNEFLRLETANVNLKRNYLALFDGAQTETVKLDCSLGVSLVDREHQERLTGKVESAHPIIPGAKISSQKDRGPLHIMKPVPHELSKIPEMIQIAAPIGQQPDQHDPHTVIKAGKVSLK